MDINFSQVGQNFAQKDTQRTNLATENGQQEIADIKKSTALDAQNNQALVDQADTDDAERETQEEVSLSIESDVNEINDFVQTRNHQLNFSIDEKSERAVVKVTDSDSGEVIRQIPSEDVLALSERIKELQTDVGSAVGVLFNKQA